MINKIKNHYDNGLYKKAHIIALVQSKKLSVEDYETIVGESYPDNVSTEKVPSAIDIAIKELQDQNDSNESKTLALVESIQFLEDCIVEMAEVVYA